MLIFGNEDIKKISELLGVEPKSYENAWIWTLINDDYSKPLVFTLYSGIDIGSESEGALVSVQTMHGYYELHGVKSYMFFEPDEVIFISVEGEYMSSLIIGKECTCSLYSNISIKILNSDFSELHPAVLLSAMQLSIAESAIRE